ncbi:hypothetical protein MASR2M78_05490 [Treponema sp.]
MSKHGGPPIRELGRSAAPLVMLILCVALLFYSCTTVEPVRSIALPIEKTAQSNGQANKPVGIADEIRLLVEMGSPPSLLRALDLIRSRDLGETEFGRSMSSVATTFMRKLYPEILADLPAIDPPQTSSYARILRDAERGSYTPSSSTSVDYLEHVLPFIVLLNETRSERLVVALPDLERAAQLNPSSVLAPYFHGIVSERRALLEEALSYYNQARSYSAESYPAVVGASRILSTLGRSAESIELLSSLILRYPDNLLVKKELARSYYEKGDWSRAGSALAEVLQKDPKDLRFLLMRAHVLVEQGAFLQAQPLLDILAVSESSNRLYLLLRARVQAEGYKNRDSALTYLRSILRVSPNDEETASYAARLLMDSSRPEDLQEGRALLARLLSLNRSSLTLTELALKDALVREAWKEAIPLSDRLLMARRSVQDLRNAYTLKRGLKDTEGALEIARELYELDTTNDDYIGLYAVSLSASGKKAEALRLIEARLVSAPSGTVKSRLFFIRSRLKTDEEGIMGDLRSSLFEDPRNLDALVAMLEIYRYRKDDRRASYYLKQALALAPDDPLLKRYQAEYMASQGGAP